MKRNVTTKDINTALKAAREDGRLIAEAMKAGNIAMASSIANDLGAMFITLAEELDEDDRNGHGATVTAPVAEPIAEPVAEPAGKSRKLIQHDDEFPTTDKWEKLGDMRFCQMCGRKLGANPLGVEVVGGGAVHDPAFGEADQNDGGYMGMMPVGMECAKKFAPGIARPLN